MISTNLLKATCPNCQHQFWRFKTCKGIKFCPNCHCNLIKIHLLQSGRPPTNTDKKLAIINDGLYLIGVTAGIYLMLSLGYEGPSVQMIGNTAPYWVLVISLALLGYLIYVQLKSRKNLVVGIDNLDEIKEDIGDYDLKQCCPNCQSQRMQDLYFFKKNHAKDLATTPAATALGKGRQVDRFLGCLSCQQQYLKVAIKTKKRHSLSRKIVNASAMVLFLPAALLISVIYNSDMNVGIMFFSRLSLADTKATYLCKAMLITAISALYVFIPRLADSPQSTSKLKPIHNKVLADH